MNKQIKFHRVPAQHNINRVNKLREATRLMSTAEEATEILSKEEMQKVMINLYNLGTPISKITDKLNDRGCKNKLGKPLAPHNVRQTLDTLGVLKVKKYERKAAPILTVKVASPSNASMSKLDGVKAILGLAGHSAESRIQLALLLIG